MKMILHENKISERGTSVAIYDYAFYLQQFLNIEPIIAYDKKNITDQKVLLKFLDKFKIIGYEDFSEIENIISSMGIDYFYAIKYGIIDNIQSNSCKNLIHSVFSMDVSQSHGRYRVVSEWMAQKSGIPYVPHMFNLPETEENFRRDYGIPETDSVIGRYGGFDTFNIDFVKEEVKTTLGTRSDVTFLFMNTEKFMEHNKCIFVPSCADLKTKRIFINTCDAMLHARDYGETFGLSVLEFAACCKRIISYDNEELQSNHSCGGRNHFLFLGDNCNRYKNKDELHNILQNIVRENPYDTNYLKEMFSPKTVIDKFEKEFLL